jgi:DNA-binding LytR/AlgR family response regulator
MSVIVKTKIDDLNWFYHLDWREIQWVEQEADYQNVVTGRGVIRIHNTMEKLHDQFDKLVRVHRSYSVNPHQMLAYAVDTEAQSVHLMFKDGKKLSIGRGRTFWDEFTETFHIAKTKKDDNGNWI